MMPLSSRFFTIIETTRLSAFHQKFTSGLGFSESLGSFAATRWNPPTSKTRSEATEDSRICRQNSNQSAYHVITHQILTVKIYIILCRRHMTCHQWMSTRYEAIPVTESELVKEKQRPLARTFARLGPGKICNRTMGRWPFFAPRTSLHRRQRS
jgi:hypothetical protein